MRGAAIQRLVRSERLHLHRAVIQLQHGAGIFTQTIGVNKKMLICNCYLSNNSHCSYIQAEKSKRTCKQMRGRKQEDHRLYVFVGSECFELNSLILSCSCKLGLKHKSS